MDIKGLVNKEKETTNILFKYERCKILAERVQQLSDGAETALDYDDSDNIYTIAERELQENKIPFLVKREVNGKEEYWKLKNLIK